MKYLWIFILLLFLSGNHQDVYDKAIKSTVNIFSPQVNLITFEVGMVGGTGVVIKEDSTKYYILTAGHVASHCSDFVYINLNNDRHNPHKSEKVSAKIVFCDDSPDPSDHEDVAILIVEKSDLKNKLRVVKLGNDKNERVITIGVPYGEYPSLIKTTKTEEKDGVFSVGFYPRPGRSGSGVFDEKCSKTLGIICRQDGECMAANKIKEILKKCFSEVDFSDETAIIGIGWAYVFSIQCSLFSARLNEV